MRNRSRFGRIIAVAAAAATCAAVLAVAPAASAGGSAPPVVHPMETPNDDEAGGLPPPPSYGGDCGYSTPLYDGNTLWVTCDPLFLPNPLEDISNTVDVVLASNPAGVSFQRENFIDPSPSLQCLSPSDRKVAWVLSVASEQMTDGRTRIVAFFRHGCVDEFSSSTPSVRARQTFGVAQYIYNPASPPTTLHAQVLSYDIWLSGYGFDTPSTADDVSSEPYGRGSVFDDGYLYAYNCPGGSVFDPHPDLGQCAVARALPADGLGYPSSWSYWDGSTWVFPVCGNPCTPAQRKAAEDQAVAMQTVFTGSPTLRQLTAEGFRVSYDLSLGLFVASSRENIEHIAYRVAEHPNGPWSAAVDLYPSCGAVGVLENPCYVNAPHPEVTTGTEAVVTYFDKNWDNDGNFLTGVHRLRFITVPLCVEDDAANAGFSDVFPNNPFYNEIQDRALACVLGGYSNGTFNPDGIVNRGAMLAFLWRQGGFDQTRYTSQTFTDVAPTHTFFNQVEWGADHALTGAFGNPNPLSLNTPVLRGHMASLLWRLNGQPALGPNPPSFQDSSAIPVRWAAQEGIMCGYPDGLFKPSNTVSRQSASAMLYREDGHPAIC